jgi:hypothetical protein
MMSAHRGYCNVCARQSPATYEERDGRVLLVKDCPDCGRTETIVSSDPASWRARRDLARLHEDGGCALNCLSCGFNEKHTPATVFVDITNRCNMECPVCIANVAGMGFVFDPPFEYFERLFEDLAALEPKPSLKLFGGEPTVRKDLPEIVRCARRAGLSTSIVTNGIKLDDADYCSELLDTRAKLIFSFDGRDPEVYRRLRGDAKVYERKLKALDNIRRRGRAKVTIMCVIAVGINDHLIGDLFDFCHERIDMIQALEFIPLARTWEPGSIEADGAEITAMEDAERIVAKAAPGGNLEFLPAGLTPYNHIAKYLPMPRLTFAGAHPNCESIAFLVSDGEKYVPISSFLKGRSLHDAIDALIRRDEAVGRRMARLRWLPGPLERLAGRAFSLGALGATLLKAVDGRAILGRHVAWKSLCILTGLLAGKKPKEVLRKHTRLRNVLRVVMLPFEEIRTLDSAKLVRCPAAFAHLSPDTGRAVLVPVCAWGLYKDDIMRHITEKYAAAAAEPKAPASSPVES